MRQAEPGAAGGGGGGDGGSAERRSAGRGSEHQRLDPSRTIRRDLEVEVVVAGEPELRPAREVRLEQMGGGLRRVLLRDLDLDVSGAALRDRLPRVEHVVELGAE